MFGTRHRLAIVAAAAALAAAASAPNPGGDPDQVVCKRQAETGTRILSRICMTRRRWAMIEEEHKRAAREMIDRPVIEIRR
jgi:hypothetical protein